MDDRLDHEAIQEEMDFASCNNNNNARDTEIKPQSHRAHRGRRPQRAFSRLNGMKKRRLSVSVNSVSLWLIIGAG
jgi:hypothetical protein